jgi:hypothetical protein
MTLRIAGAEVEVFGESAEEVRSVAESMAKVLLSQLPSDPSDKADPASASDQNRASSVNRSDEGASEKVGDSVFISHASQDIPYVENELLPLLKQNGLTPWYSKDDIRTAEHWERKILHALSRCDWFLIVLSPSSAKSEWVKDELHWAISYRRGKIIPVLIEKCNLQEFHIRLSRIEYADYYTDPERARKRILAAIRGEDTGVLASTTAVATRKRWWEFWK